MDTVEKAKPRGWFRRLMLQLELGVLLGLVSWTLVGASLITWWYKPPVDQALSCSPMVQSALADFSRYQMIAAGVGAALVMIVSALVRRKPAPVASPSPSTRLP